MNICSILTLLEDGTVLLARVQMEVTLLQAHVYSKYMYNYGQL